MQARCTPIQNVTVAAVFCNAQVCQIVFFFKVPHFKICWLMKSPPLVFFFHRTHTCCVFLEIVTLSKHKKAQKAKADDLTTQDDLKCPLNTI